jgi:hypothetical protein
MARFGKSSSDKERSRRDFEDMALTGDITSAKRKLSKAKPGSRPDLEGQLKADRREQSQRG